MVFPYHLALPIFLSLLLAIYQFGLLIYNLWFHPLAKFPGPISRGGLHVVDYWHYMFGTQLTAIKGLHDKYGPVVRIRPNTLTFINPGAWKDIYGSRPGKGQIEKDEQAYSMGGLNENNIIYCNDADHTRMRRLLSHAFSDGALRQQEDILTKYFNLFITSLQSRITSTDEKNTPFAVVDMAKWYNFVTFDIIGDMCFGESFGQLETGDYHTWLANLFGAIKTARFIVIAIIYQPLLTILFALMSIFPFLAKARLEHQQFCEQKTKKRLETETNRKDFMSYILRHNDDRGMTKKEIMGTSSVLIAAGSETTATLLSGVTYLLLKNPDKYAKVKDEIRSAFSSAEEMSLLSTSRLQYLHACLEEALRVYPPVPGMLSRRTGPEGAIIDGVPIPADTIIAVTQFAAFHSSNNFTDPEAFVPERWLPNPPQKYKGDNRDVLQPFSTGPRNCIGKNLAYNEMRSIMARMLWHFDMELVDKEKNWLNQPVYVLWEKPPLNIKLTPRKVG